MLSLVVAGDYGCFIHGGDGGGGMVVMGAHGGCGGCIINGVVVVVGKFILGRSH